MKKNLFYNRIAYEAGKLLDFSKWEGFFPRGINWTDNDMMLDNRGKILMVELKSNCANWSDVSEGQRRLATSFVLNGRGSQFAIVAQHVKKEPGEYINTWDDILAWQLMYYKRVDDFDCIRYLPVRDGRDFPQAVHALMFGEGKARQEISEGGEE